MLRVVSGDLRKATSALVGFSKGSGLTAQEERASERSRRHGNKGRHIVRFSRRQQRRASSGRDRLLQREINRAPQRIPEVCQSRSLAVAVRSLTLPLLPTACACRALGSACIRHLDGISLTTPE